VGLPCLNCQQEVAPDEAKFFAECFLCPSCYLIAERTLQQGQRELHYLLVSLKELVRLAILRGELRLPPAAEQATERKMNVVDALVELAQHQKVQPCLTPPSRSTESSSRGTTKPDALPAAGLPSCDSTPDVDSTSGTSPTTTTHTEPVDA
jgi:hypothetical protein